MIEIPSAAATVDLLAKTCDFFSVGTNDLIQYTLAIDRGNDRIAHLYEPCHPAVVRTLKRIVDDAHRLKRPVGVCGEMAGDPVYAALLLGMGVELAQHGAPRAPGGQVPGAGDEDVRRARSRRVRPRHDLGEGDLRRMRQVPPRPGEDGMSGRRGAGGRIRRLRL